MSALQQILKKARQAVTPPLRISHKDLVVLCSILTSILEVAEEKADTFMLTRLENISEEMIQPHYWEE